MRLRVSSTPDPLGPSWNEEIRLDEVLDLGSHSSSFEVVRRSRMPFAAEHHYRADAHVVKLSGELDLAVEDAATLALRAAASDGRARLVVDLADLSFLDSTGLRVLIDAACTAEMNGIAFVLADPQPSVYRLFHLTQTADRFEFTSLDGEDRSL
jgi:anti-anti-sigma factor